MGKRFHDVRNMKKTLTHGSKVGLGPFRKKPPRPKPEEQKKRKEESADGK